MAYTPQTWTDGAAGGTPITAARLGYIETGVDTAHDNAQTAADAAATAATAAATAQTTANSATTSAATANTANTTLAARNMQPADIGLVGWSFDPRAASGNVTFTQGIEHFVRVWVASPVPSLSRLIYGSATLGSAITAVNIGLRDSTGSLLATWPDQSANWLGTTGRIIATLASPLTSLAAGSYYVGIQYRGTTSASIYRSTQTGGLIAGALATGPYANGDIGSSADTSLPSTRDLTTMTINTQPFWIGLAA